MFHIAAQLFKAGAKLKHVAPETLRIEVTIPVFPYRLEVPCL